MSSRWLRPLLALSLIAAVVVGLSAAIGLAQSASVSWTAGPGVGGTANGVTLLTNTASEGAPAAPVSASDGTTTKSATVMPDNPGDVFRYLYFLVNTSGFPAGYSFARVDVEYLDEAGLAGSRLMLQYNSTTSAFQGSDQVQLLGTGRFQVATFHLTNVAFGRQGNFSSDFRLMDLNDKGVKVTSVTVTGSTTSTRTSGSSPVVFDINANPSSSGLTLKSGGDGVVAFTTDCGGVACGRTAVKISDSGYMYLDVDDGYMANGSPGDAQVEVSYFDRGFGYFYINYDAQPGSTATFKDSFTWGSFDSPDPDRSLYQANNIVYLQNTNGWKTYRFNLSNVYFGNRLGLQSDIKITQARGGASELARAGYDLRIDRVTVTRFTTPIDKTGQLEGNFSGYGAPAWVWTQLGTINEQGHGLYQDEATAATTAASAGGRSGRRLTGGTAYFNINDNYLKNGVDGNGKAVKSVLIGVEYYDAGGVFALDYDSTAGTRSADVVTLTGTNTWKRASFYITDGRFNNALTGGNDFAVKVTSGPNDLLVRDVVVTRTIGENRTGSVPTGFTRRQQIVGVHHFPVFDGYRPALWERSTIAPAGTGADAYTTNPAGQNVVNTSYSYRNVATHVKELTDMRDAGIDFMLVWHAGNTVDQNTIGVVAARKLVEAARLVSNAPKIGLLLDPVHAKPEPLLRNKDALLDLADPSTYGQVIKMAEDFFSLVPRDMWATIEGRPIIALYYQGGDVVVRQDSQIIQRLIDRFEATHGVKPYVIADRFYDPNGTLNLPTDDYFSWGAALCKGAEVKDDCVPSGPGFAQRSVFEIGPGFDDGVGTERRTRDRESGAFYSRGWDRAAGKGNHMVLIDTFNYFVEGTAISQTREFGRTYLDLTAQKSAVYKQRNYASAQSVRVDLGEPSVYGGMTSDEVPDGLTTTNPGGGRRASGRFMSFSVHDSFIESQATPVRITVEYLDAGVSAIDVKVDGAAGEVTAGRIDVMNSRTGQFKTATFTVDAFFGNRLTFANDIRLDTDIAGAMVIKSVMVERVGAAPTPTPVSCVASQAPSAGGALPTPTANQRRSLVPAVFRSFCLSA